MSDIIDDAIAHASSLRFPENVLADEVARLRSRLALAEGVVEAARDVVNARDRMVCLDAVFSIDQEIDALRARKAEWEGK